MITFGTSISPIYFAAFENTATGEGQYTVNAGDVRPISDSSNLAQTDVLDVILAKTVDKTQAIEGDRLTYTIKITNNSSIPINNVVMSDIIDANTVYDASNTIPYVTLSNGYTVGTIPGRNSAPNNVFTLVFTATINQNVRGTVVNTANLVSYNYTDAHGVTYNGTPQQVTAVTVVQDIDVKINKTVTPQSAQIGDTVLYTITIVNDSSTQITGVVVRDSSVDLNYTSISNIRLNGVVLTPQPSLSSGINVGLIAPATSASITFNATVLNTAPNTLNNTALITYSYADGTQIVTIPDVPSNQATLNIIKPEIVVEKYANTAILIHDGTVKHIQYSVFVRNTGNVAINNVRVTDVLPVGTTYQPNSTYISAIGPTNNSPEPAAGGIFIDTVPAGATIPILFSVDVIL